MEVILIQDFANLGFKDEIVTVKNGYARNYLLPQGIAILATDTNKKILAETIKQRAFKAEKIKKEAEELGSKLNEQTIKVAVKASEKGNIFGSVNTMMISDAIKAQLDMDIDRKKITIDGDAIKALGTYTAKAALHKEVKVGFNVEVVAE